MLSRLWLILLDMPMRRRMGECTSSSILKKNEGRYGRMSKNNNRFLCVEKRGPSDFCRRVCDFLRFWQGEIHSEQGYLSLRPY